MPIVTATAADGSASALWSLSTNGANITGVTVTISPKPPNGPASQNLPGNATSARFDKLTNGTPYTITVVAHSNHGDSPSGSSSVTPKAGQPPKPANVRAAPGDGSITVAWTMPSLAPGATYTLTATPASGGQPVVASALTSPGSIPGLQNGVGYRVTVTVKGANGTSTTSDPAGPVTPFGKPGKPDLKADAGQPNGNQGTVTLTMAPGSTGGSPITEYRLRGPGVPATVPAGPNGGATVRVQIPAGSTGNWYAAAVNAAGAGPEANASASVKSPGPQPGDIEKVNFGGNGFNWIGPTSGEKWQRGDSTHIYWYRFAMNGGASTVNWQCRTPGTYNPARHTGATWTKSLPASGRWKVEVYIPGGRNSPGGYQGQEAGFQYYVNGQSVIARGAGGGGTWLTLGTYSLKAGSNTVKASDLNPSLYTCNTGNIATYLVISDARFVYQGP